MLSLLLAVGSVVGASHPTPIWRHLFALGVAFALTALVGWWAHHLKQTEPLRRPEAAAFFEEDEKPLWVQ